MPSRNIIKQYAAHSYYHVYTRGVAKQAVFLDEKDYVYFISLFKRYLSSEPQYSPARIKYPWYTPRLNLISFCLMPNHVHLLVFQQDEKALSDFMRSLMTSYSMYFNKKYKRVGHVFQSRYKASLIDHQNYMEHITRYIHLNPYDWEHYPYSSLQYFIEDEKVDWLKPTEVLELFPSKQQYLEFVRDYTGYKEMLDEIHWELADS
ncbi:MAG: transposase [Candidatus Saccharimonadales bacterium]